MYLLHIYITTCQLQLAAAITKMQIMIYLYAPPAFPPCAEMRSLLCDHESDVHDPQTCGGLTHNICNLNLHNQEYISTTSNLQKTLF